MIAAGLLSAVRDLSARGLHSAARWAGEQLESMDYDGESALSSVTWVDEAAQIRDKKEMHKILFASTLITSGDYQRAASVLRPHAGRRLSSPLGVFLSAYSLYLAGEKIKDQLAAEADGDSIPASIKNPFLTEIYRELSPLHAQGEMDGHLLYIFGVVVRELQMTGAHTDLSKLSVAEIFLKSVTLYPWNWSCWLELSDLLVNSGKIHSIRDVLSAPPSGAAVNEISHEAGAHSSAAKPVKWYYSPAAPLSTTLYDFALPQDARSQPPNMLIGYINHPMHCFFLAHCLVELQKFGSYALTVVKSLRGGAVLSHAPPFTRSPAVLVQEALALYSVRDYDGSQRCFEILREQDPYRIEHLDTFSNILYVKEQKVELCYLAHMMVKVEKYSPVTCAIIGNYYSLKRNHERAVTYFQRALKLNPDFTSAWTLMGHEYVELRNAAAAVHCYREAVKFRPGHHSSDYRAWYGLGQAYEMLHLYAYALHYYQKATVLRPDDARMWCAVGKCLSRLSSSSGGSSGAISGASGGRGLGTPRQQREGALLAYERAVQCDDREGVATRELARMHREIGNIAQAATCFKSFLTIHDSANTIERGADQNKDESLISGNDNMDIDSISDVVGGAAGHDRGSCVPVTDEAAAEACEFLANYCRDAGRYDDAAFYCSRLLEYPGSEGDRARGLLKELHKKMRSRTANEGGAKRRDDTTNSGIK